MNIVLLLCSQGVFVIVCSIISFNGFNITTVCVWNINLSLCDLHCVQCTHRYAHTYSIGDMPRIPTTVYFILHVCWFSLRSLPNKTKRSKMQSSMRHMARPYFHLHRTSKHYCNRNQIIFYTYIGIHRHTHTRR